MESVSQFEGFTFPHRDFFKTPNDFVEAMAQIDSLAELKVILYVMRHTWGYQEYDEHKRISVDEFMYGRKMANRERMDSGTGLSEIGVKSGIAKAISHGFLECEVDKSDLGRIQKSYRLKLKDNADGEEETQDVQPATPNVKRSILHTMPYEDYLKTPEWAKKRNKALRFANYRCQLCNTQNDLTVHHRTYERRGYELMGDLIVLCKDCHDTFTYNRELAK